MTFELISGGAGFGFSCWQSVLKQAELRKKLCDSYGSSASAVVHVLRAAVHGLGCGMCILGCGACVSIS